jgi:hypothetical protein
VIESGRLDRDPTSEIQKEEKLTGLGFPVRHRRRACALEVDVTDDAEGSGGGEDADEV